MVAVPANRLDRLDRNPQAPRQQAHEGRVGASTPGHEPASRWRRHIIESDSNGFDREGSERGRTIGIGQPIDDAGARVAAVVGHTISITTNGGTVTVDNAKVVKTDIVASNGVIHVIDSVIVPKDK